MITNTLPPCYGSQCINNIHNLYTARTILLYITLTPYLLPETKKNFKIYYIWIVYRWFDFDGRESQCSAYTECKM